MATHLCGFNDGLNIFFANKLPISLFTFLSSKIHIESGCLDEHFRVMNDSCKFFRGYFSVKFFFDKVDDSESQLH